MDRLRLFFLAAAAATVLWLPAPRAGHGKAWPSLAAPACASVLLSTVGRQEESYDYLAETSVTRFLRAHTTLVIILLPILMGAVYVMIFGPADVLDAWRRLPRRNRGFMTPPGGFGGISRNFRNPWE